MRADMQFVSVSTLKLPPPDTYDVAIAALFVRVADRKGNVAFPDDQRAFVNQLIAAGKPTVVIGFGSPYLITTFPDAPSWLGRIFDKRRFAARRRPRAVWPGADPGENSGNGSRRSEAWRWITLRSGSDGAAARFGSNDGEAAACLRSSGSRRGE